MNNKIYNKKLTCRLCKSSELISVLELVSTPPANAFVTKDKLSIKQTKYPLELFFCKNCNHVQITDIVDPTQLFENYVYVSGTSPVFVEHFKNYAKNIIETFKPPIENYILDIGSNDGTLLKFFKELGYSVVGIDPAKEIANKASKEGIETINDFFNLESSKKIKEKYSKASLITANNVFAHCDDLSGITEAVSNLLIPNGLFVFEVSYLVDVYQKTLFDTIYHEHLSYHSVTPLVKFFQDRKMTLIDVLKVNTHGGSIRCVVRNSENVKVKDSVNNFIKLEKSLLFDNCETFINFSNKIDDRKNELNDLLVKLKLNDKTIAGFGAPAKATTLMYEFGLNSDILDFIVDDSPLKQGLYTPGLHIPVLSSSYIEIFKPDYLLILAWNFAGSIVKNNKKFHESGGKFIIPLPKLEVI